MPVTASLSLLPVRRAARLLLTSVAALAALAGPRLAAGPVTPEHRALIAAALPASAPAKPLKPRRVLVYTQTKGYRHASIETGVEAFRMMGERTGAYTVTAAAVPDVFTPSSLAGFDAVLFLNTTGEIFELVESRKALLDFVRGGGGIMGVHSATDTCYSWPEWGEMMGGFFDSHPWTAERWVTLWNEEPDHPLTAAFGGAVSFAVQDEIYQLKAPYSRATHRVLLSLDLRRSDFNHPEIAQGIKRTDGDFAVSQLRTYEKGRVFYCSLGHNHHIYWDPKVMQHYLAGLQWAMGDLQADATPRPRRTPPPLAADPALFEAVAKTTFTDPQRAFGWLDTAIAEAGTDVARLAAIEDRLAGLIGQPTTTPAARLEIAARLGRLMPANPSARRPSLRALGALLNDPATLEAARLGLDPVPGRAVDDLYLRALRGSSGAARGAIVQSLGTRRTAAAVGPLTALLRESDPAIVKAAITALGRIGGEKAVGALRPQLALHPETAAEALLAAAPTLKPAEAIRLYVWLGAPRSTPEAGAPGSGSAKVYRDLDGAANLPEHLRDAAWLGLLAAEPSAASDRLVEALSGGSRSRRQLAIERLATAADASLPGRVGPLLSYLTPEMQTAAIAALGRRGEAASVPFVLAATKHAAPEVRVAALEALGFLPGSPEVAQALASVALGEGDEAKAAAASLGQLDGPGVAGAILAGARQGAPALRSVFLRQLSRRGMTEGLPVLLGCRADPSSEVRLAALEGLDTLAGMAEQAAILAWAIDATAADERNRAVRTLISLTLRDPDTIGRTRALLNAIESGPSATRLLLLPAMVRLPNAQGLASVARLARDQDAAVAENALATLVRWPDSAAARPLAELAEDAAAGSARRAVAVEGALKHLERLPAPARAEPSSLPLRLLSSAADDAARRRLLYLVSLYDDPAALAAAEALASDPGVGGAARDAAMAIRANALGSPVVTASGSGAQARVLVDPADASFWSVPARKDQWLQIDLRQTRPVRKIILDRGTRTNDFPPAYAVFVTDDPTSPGEPRVSGKGDRETQTVTLPEGVYGRYVIVRLTETRDRANWSVADLRVE